MSRTLVLSPHPAVDGTEENTMILRLFKSTAVALAVATIAVPLAGAATDADDGYKSGYPQLHAIHTYNANQPTPTVDDGYKSGYPQLHAIHTFGTPAARIENAGRTFHWSDAAIGAGTAAGAIVFLALAGLLLGRRQTRLAV
jgi:hypothetical protein